ncbi:MAG: cheA [Myxococcaceae bacterium]|nr:cheA [Myxococcaceae bacterium]
MDEIVQEFLIESRESLDELDRALVALEKDPRHAARLSSIFRTVHTIKGTAGFLQFAKLESITHVGESLLSRMRDGIIVLDSVRTTALLAMVDAIRTLLSQVESAGAEGAGEYECLIQALLLAGKDETLELAAELLRAQAKTEAQSLEPLFDLQVGAPSQEPPPRRDESGSSAPEQGHGETRIRVDVRLLDQLMNLVGELVLARNQLLQCTSGSDEPALQSSCQRLSAITTELQEGVMKTRMQSIENVWNRFPRLVRDLAQQCGKQVHLEMYGGNTELDKTIIEAIADPLTHLVRNSIDHGIEPSEQRTAAGKPAVGALRIRAFHQGGRVNIEVSDDGRGIDAERVIARALQRGLITQEGARSLPTDDVYGLLFMPGFSTAETVTHISGRGVGLDVVRSNIERLGGSVDIDSQPGRGTTFRIRIPLTLAIIPALLVGSSGERFAIPQLNLIELLRIEADQVTSLIERIHGVPVYRLRGKLLALVELGEVLDLGREQVQRDRNLIVLQTDDSQFGLLVDDIFDTEEIVVKPLGRELRGLPCFAGATIMGDGRVALILDVAGLALRAGVKVAGRKLAGPQSARSDQAPKAHNEQQILLFRSGQNATWALALDAVSRLEEFPRSRVELVGGVEVVQYRGEILPLVHLSEAFGDPRIQSETLQVLVHKTGERHVGFVVDAIEDVIQQEIVSSRRAGRPGTLGSAVVRGKVVEVLDPAAMCGLLGE